MQTRHLKSDLLFLLSAIIWGFAFVAQRMGMDHVGPFTFNGIRFLLGAMVLVPFIYRNRDHRPRKQVGNNPLQLNRLMLYGGLAGLAIFAGASLQQVGLVYTTAGKAGFITGLYVVIVPIMGLLWGQQTNLGTWGGAVGLSHSPDRLAFTQNRFPAAGFRPVHGMCPCQSADGSCF